MIKFIYGLVNDKMDRFFIKLYEASSKPGGGGGGISNDLMIEFKVSAMISE